ncbi:MAG TPA: XTP/dITP diphosphatase [Verrucomicrobiae bacterium]|jgi:XTP/dITP diphosphohydrolase|nr:XTP/dITP diphosphatase [Verrucomicrobiae bacterium]
MKILVATTNPGKLAEIAAFLSPLGIEILSLSDLKNPPVVTEDGDTFEANALKKARTLAVFSGLPTLADDSGLEVEALAGAPGIHSARYSGEDANDAGNNEKLLRALAGIPEERRAARFVCVLALSMPPFRGGAEQLFRAECAGRIGFEPRGDKGFGYDPLFFYPPLGRTFGELDRETKSGVSHRGRALKRLAAAWPDLKAIIKQPRIRSRG